MYKSFTRVLFRIILQRCNSFLLTLQTSQRTISIKWAYLAILTTPPMKRGQFFRLTDVLMTITVNFTAMRPSKSKLL